VEYIELEGKDTDEILQRASEKLGVPVEDLKYEVIEKGTRGIFSILDNRLKKLRITYEDPVEKDIRAKLGFMLDKIGVTVDIEVAKSDKNNYTVRIKSNELDGLLIGKHGQTLDAIQHLLNRQVNHKLENPVYITVDVGDYRERQDSMIQRKAQTTAAKVKATGKEIKLEPMTAAERKKVHMALSEDPDVRTYSVGEGQMKSVVIAPAAQEKASERVGGGGTTPTSYSPSTTPGDTATKISYGRSKRRVGR